MVTPENIDSLILEPIPQCSVYTNNPYHESGGVNDLLPTGAIYTKLKGQAFICKECNSGFLPTLDRTQCLAPTVKSNCKSYTNVECRECSSGFSRQKNLFREVVSEQNQSEFDRESFFLNFFEFANEVILLDPSQNPHLTKNFDECKSRSFLPNCKVAESLNVCRVCADGHFLDSSFRCQPNPLPRILYCSKYTSSNSCQECVANFVHQQSSTISILSHTVELHNCRPLDAGEKIPNCLFYRQIGNLVMCVRCADDHFLDPSSLTEVGGVAHSNGCVPRLDSKFVGGCLQYSARVDTCEECVQGLGLSADGLVCLGHIDHCLEYNLDKNGDLVHLDRKSDFFR